MTFARIQDQAPIIEMNTTIIAPMVRRAAPNFRVIAMIVASAMLMENIDATVMTTALPRTRRELARYSPSATDSSIRRAHSSARA